MDFEHSTQARSWIFTSQSLAECREQKLQLENESSSLVESSCSSVSSSSPKARNFASGFHRRFQKVRNELPKLVLKKKKTRDQDELTGGGKRCGGHLEAVEHTHPKQLSFEEQEIIIRFHSNQICKLVGPSALCPQLRRSDKVVSTAIMFFRRFYLSNNIMEFNCRRMATAAAFLACKVEEERINIHLLSQATNFIQEEAYTTPLYGNQLKGSSVKEIEAAERTLLEGLNFEMMCFHPNEAISLLAMDLSNFFAHSCDGPVADYALALREDIYLRAQAVCYRALTCSDAPFLFAPGRIAFAAATIALKSINCQGLSDEIMEDFLRCRFSDFSPEELDDFEDDVNEIVHYLQGCPAMELSKHSWNEAEELRHVLVKIAEMHGAKIAVSTPSHVASKTFQESIRKRSRAEALQSQPRAASRKCPRVTPNYQNCSPITSRHH